MEDVEIARKQLNILLQTKDSLYLERKTLEKLSLSFESLASHPATEYFQSRRDFFQAKRSLEKQHLLPDISLSYSVGSNPTLNENLHKYQVGLKIPLFFGGNASKIKASKIAMEINDRQAE